MSLGKEKAVQHYINSKKREYELEEIIKGVLSGDRAMLSRAITLANSTLKEDREKSRKIIDKCFVKSKDTIRIGISGIPGVGKSTLIEALGKIVLKAGYKLAVLTVDPSSSNSKGSILGDKMRMDTLSNSEDVFIRTTPSSGKLGGVAGNTRESIILCEAAGYNVIFVETVGVGQSEIEVRSMVDIFLLLQLANTGDDYQGIKKGVIEIADVIVVNKADGINKLISEETAQNFNKILGLLSEKESQWEPVALSSSSFVSTDVESVWRIIQEYNLHIQANGFFIQQRRQQMLKWMYDAVNQEIYESFYNNREIKKLIKKIERDILDDKITLFMAIEILLKAYFDK
jgi:LAO/AO transport system kinase